MASRKEQAGDAEEKGVMLQDETLSPPLFNPQLNCGKCVSVSGDCWEALSAQSTALPVSR